ncbi:transcriptional regulator [Catellatospora sichuanensis]|uniref:transcriptional regulator n=1 Tax=Catellatospora sichuanensis TaxID=1969805 RepID=UPI001183FAB2|nr:transcriptional regulator [Catellatospora sichuanensis]
MSSETPELVAHKRMISARTVLENRADLRAYPHRHLAIVSQLMAAGEGVTQLLAAVEILDRFGWDLVNVSELTGRQVYAFMRRR